MTVKMYKTDAVKLYDQESLKNIKKPKSSCCEDKQNKVINLNTTLQNSAAMGVGLGGYPESGPNPMSNPQTIDQKLPLDKNYEISLSERDLLKILEES